MKLLPVCLLSILIYSSCDSQNNSKTDETRTETAQPESDGNFYKRLEGTIADQPVVMHLHRAGNNYNGIYYYTNVGKWLTLSVDSIGVDSVYLSEYSPGDGWKMEELVNATMRCKLTDDKLTGIWISGDKKKTFPVTLTESYPDGVVRFDMRMYRDSVIAFPNKTDGPVASIDRSFVTARDEEWINKQIKHILDIDSNTSFDAGIKKLTDTYFTGYKNNLPDPGDTTIPLAVYNYANSGSLYVRYDDNSIVVLESDFYDYAGGAHGNYGSMFYCYDVTGKRQLQLSDILSADSATLQPIVEQYFRIQYHVKEKSLKGVLFDDHLALTDNFYLTGKGIGFLYNPYEVASYAQGQVNVFVPFTAVNQYLTTYIRKRLAL